jgi:hypothetical protein
MGRRLFAVLSATKMIPRVKHYLGAPPELTGGADTRREMGRAHLLVIKEEPDGVLLYRYNSRGECVGDTWHLNIDDAKYQATYEYDDLAPDWQDVPQEIKDPVAYGLSRPRQ